MSINKRIYPIFLLLIAGSIACNITGLREKAQLVEKTAQAISTKVGGMVTAGGDLIKTAQALETQHPGIVETVKAVATIGAPIISTVQAVATDNPGLVATAQAFITKEVPSGDPPSNIPIINREQAQNFFGTSQYIIYTTSTDYQQVLEFYKFEMPNNGWQYLENDSHEYNNAAQLNYFNNASIATINLSYNPINYTTVVIVNILAK